MKSLHFLYHELRSSESRYSYVVTSEQFEAHCAFFSRVRRETSAKLLRPEITFDDGNLSDLQVAVPVLDRHGLRATFFITAGWTGQRSGFLNWPDLRQMHAAGHGIGAHGMTHKLLTACSATELDLELRGARERLEDGLGAPVQILSLPGGRRNARVLRACEEAGYRQIFTSVPCAEEMERSPQTVGRLNLLGDTTVPFLERVLDPASGTLAQLERADRVKSAAKAVLGDRLYAKVWALANRQEPELSGEAGAPVS